MVVLDTHGNLRNTLDWVQTWSKNVMPSILPAFLRLRMMSGAKRAVSEKLLCSAKSPSKFNKIRQHRK